MRLNFWFIRQVPLVLLFKNKFNLFNCFILTDTPCNTWPYSVACLAYTQTWAKPESLLPNVMEYSCVLPAAVAN